MSDPCPWTLDDAGYARVLDVIRAPIDCTPPDGWRGLTVSSTIMDVHGHELDGDYDPKGEGGCDHRDTPEWQAEHQGDRREPSKMPPKNVPALDPELEEAAPATHDPLVEPVKAAAPTVASVAQVVDTVDVSKFLPAGTDSGLVAVLLAALAIGGVAVKFVPNFLKTRAEKAKLEHEQRMKELELQSDNQKRDDDREQKCASRNAELLAKVTVLEGKIAPLESRVVEAEARAAKAEEAASKAGGASIDFAGDELEDKLETFSKRITKIETALKKKAGK